MSVTGRITDKARSVMAKITVDDNGLHGIDEAALQAELEARLEVAKKKPPSPADKNPRSRYAGADAKSAAARRQMAARRRQKIHAVRDRREKARQRAEEEAFRRVKEQARRQSSGTSSRRPPPRGSRTTGGLGDLGRDPEIARAYKTLDLGYGAPIAEVKTAYRKLMRKYHPDLHNQSPKKQKAATELTMKVTQAYNVLEKHLKA